MKFKKLFSQNRSFFSLLFIWLVLFSGIRTAQHFSFGTNACDLSLFDYGMFYTLNGELMSDPFHQFGLGEWTHDKDELGFKPVKAQRWESHFSVHFTPIIFFVVPFYLLFKGPLFLLYLEVLFVGFSAIPLYFITKKTLKEKYAPFLIVFLYLFFRQLLIGLMHDFHIELFFPFFIFCSYYFIAIEKKTKFFFLFMTLALFIREDIAIIFFFFGIFIFFKLKEKKCGLATALYSLIYFIFALGLFIPLFRSKEGLDGLYMYNHFGDNFKQIVENILLYPGILVENIHVGMLFKKLSNFFFPLLLIPFLSSHILLAITPILIAILSKNPQHYNFGIHYSATLLPFIFISFIYGLKNIKNLLIDDERKGKKIFLYLVIFLLFINLTNSNFWRIIRPSEYKALKDYKYVAQLIDNIPQEASVAAQSALIPHIPKRKNIFMLPEMNEAEYILIHSEVNLWPYSKNEFANFVKRLENEEKYKILIKRGGIMLWNRLD